MRLRNKELWQELEEEENLDNSPVKEDPKPYDKFSIEYDEGGFIVNDPFYTRD